MYAILSHGGRQYRVSAGDRLVVDRLDAEVGSVVALEPVLLTGGDGTTALGKDMDGLRVAVIVVAHRRGEKLRVFKYRAKKRTRKVAGYRSDLTELRVELILGKGAALPRATASAAPRSLARAAEPVASRPARRAAAAQAATTSSTKQAEPAPAPKVAATAAAGAAKRASARTRAASPAAATSSAETTAAAPAKAKPKPAAKAERTPAAAAKPAPNARAGAGAALATRERAMAHKKGGGSSRNGRDSAGRRLGIKRQDGEVVFAGSILVRQRGTKILAGENVGVGRDHTLYARATGLVAFDSTGKDRTRANVRSLPIIEVGELVELDEVVEAPSSAG